MRELTLQEQSIVGGGYLPFDYAQAIAIGVGYLAGVSLNTMFGYLPANHVAGMLSAHVVAACW